MEYRSRFLTPSTPHTVNDYHLTSNMTHPSTPNSSPSDRSAGLTDLALELQELSSEDAANVRGGLLSSTISSFDGDGKALKITDETSNTITFSWGATHIG